MSIRWEGDLAQGLAAFATEVFRDTEDALADGADVILADSDERVPKESGHLAGSGKVVQGRGGANTVAITYAGPYARWIHEHLGFKHPHGGQAKFLETAMMVKGRDAIQVAGERLWRRG